LVLSKSLLFEELAATSQANMTEELMDVPLYVSCNHLRSPLSKGFVNPLVAIYTSTGSNALEHAGQTAYSQNESDPVFNSVNVRASKTAEIHFKVFDVRDPAQITEERMIFSCSCSLNKVLEETRVTLPLVSAKAALSEGKQSTLTVSIHAPEMPLESRSPSTSDDESDSDSNSDDETALNMRIKTESLPSMFEGSPLNPIAAVFSKAEGSDVWEYVDQTEYFKEATDVTFEKAIELEGSDQAVDLEIRILHVDDPKNVDPKRVVGRAKCTLSQFLAQRNLKLYLDCAGDLVEKRPCIILSQL